MSEEDINNIRADLDAATEAAEGEETVHVSVLYAVLHAAAALLAEVDAHDHA